MKRDEICKKSNVIRVNYSITPETKDYISKLSADFGMSASAVITMIVQTYKQQREVVATMSDLGSLISQMKEIQEKQLLIDSEKNIVPSNDPTK